MKAQNLRERLTASMSMFVCVWVVSELTASGSVKHVWSVDLLKINQVAVISQVNVIIVCKSSSQLYALTRHH